MMGHLQKFALPPLLFGNERAQLHTCAQAFGDKVDAIFPGLIAYEPTPTSNGIFRSKSDQIELDGVSLMSASVSPTYVERKNNTVLTLLLPITGDPVCSAQVGADRVGWGLNQCGVLLPITDERVIGTGGFRNQLMLQVDADCLQAQAHSMLGLRETSISLGTDTIKRLSLVHGRFSLLQPIIQTIPLLRDYLDQPAILNQLKINDFLLRWIVVMLRPELFLDASQVTENTVTSPDRWVDRLCEFMAAHLSEPLALSDLERFSGMSTRSIQYAFKKTLDCSPMSWLREQRLGKAHQLLLSHSDMNISQVAMACGFVSASLFASSYRQKYGVNPSQARSMFGR
jgi:AraC-like DNA-binding protein